MLCFIVILAITTWIFFCLWVFGRAKISGLRSELEESEIEITDLARVSDLRSRDMSNVIFERNLLKQRVQHLEALLNGESFDGDS